MAIAPATSVRPTWLTRRSLCAFGGLLIVCQTTSAHADAQAVHLAGGRLVYEQDERGNRIPDFSNCGYAGAERETPDVPVRVTVSPSGNGDDGPRIQAAIDHIATLSPDEHGLRGAVLLAPGRFEVADQLRIVVSGIVLRGSGATEDGTTLVATGADRRSLIRVIGPKNRPAPAGPAARVADDYVPVGATMLKLDSAEQFHRGDRVLVTRPSTAAWIKALKMDGPTFVWKPDTRDLHWDRTITAIHGQTIVLDAPITTAIERQYGGASVLASAWPEQIENVGIEDLRLTTAYDETNPLDENHAWFGVTAENCRDIWARRVEFRHFAGGAIALWESASRATVEDCLALEPASEVGGYRRHTFFTQGQQNLFLRCWSERGRHDFSVGNCAPGPNAFVNCYAAGALDDSGPLESWASGVLYDNVRIDGAGLDLTNRWIVPPGAGWSAANCVLWQCQAATMNVLRPPTANNWAIGIWAGLSGDGTFQGRSDFVSPTSLYQAQLAERMGDKAAARTEPFLSGSDGATNPTVAEAAKFVEQSRKPPRQLIDVIRANIAAAADAARNGTHKGATTIDRIMPKAKKTPAMMLAIQNGWLVIDGKLVTGGLLDPVWWRGTTRPEEAPAFGPSITRFVPGRVGTGFTDDLSETADKMLAEGKTVYDHHYGLWYDRRRDDHLMVREADGNVAAPFYEQPFARSGVGAAWDGLSKYDLTKYNAWYWGRLHDFARLCDERGLVLFHQNYFQHNILEAGAHWADCPWRPANNVNDTGLPEPPVYIGDKRQFMAPFFYDLTDPRLRELHRRYIRQCLDNFADTSNVIQMTSAEYSGPLEFVQFWLDTIIDWQKEHGRKALVALSAPKDVQDAILADPRRGPHVDVIDIRYWAYTAGDELYAPTGGQNLTPRQLKRQTKQKPGGSAAIVKAVREYRTSYPDKAVTYYADEYCPSGRDGWAVLMGGGSLADVKLPEPLARAIPTMRPADDFVSGKGQYCLASADGACLVYTEERGDTIDLKLPRADAIYHASWIDPKSGEVLSSDEFRAEDLASRAMKTNLLFLTTAKDDR
jgi:Family of unknown function (DUF6298)